MTVNTPVGYVPPSWPPTDSQDTDQTTDEFWEVDGVGLNTLAYNITTLEGRSNIPVRRGENVVYGDRPGAQWVQKPEDQRVVTLAMYVQGTAPDSEWDRQLPTDNTRIQFNENVRTLKRLFGRSDRLLTLTRRTLYRPPDNVLVMTAQAETTGAMEVTMQGPGHATFTVDLLLPDPFWYSEAQSALTIMSSDVGLGTGFDLIGNVGFGGVSYHDLALGVRGDVPSFPTFTFNGPVTMPEVNLLETGEKFRWKGSLLAGASCVVDMKERTCTVGGATRYSEVDRSVSTWFGLQPNTTNTLRFRAGVYNSTATMRVDWLDTNL